MDCDGTDNDDTSPLHIYRKIQGISRVDLQATIRPAAGKKLDRLAGERV
jgi:hypothetical protein